MRLVMILFAACSISVLGCASITVNSATGTITAHGLFTSTAHTLGISPVSVTSAGIGIHRTQSALSVGWHREVALYVPNGANDCRIVIVKLEAEQLEQLIATLVESGVLLSEVCTQTPKELR